MLSKQGGGILLVTYTLKKALRGTLTQNRLGKGAAGAALSLAPPLLFSDSRRLHFAYLQLELSYHQATSLIPSRIHSAAQFIFLLSNLYLVVVAYDHPRACDYKGIVSFCKAVDATIRCDGCVYSVMADSALRYASCVS
jgi:hypothetical protein